MTYTFDDLVRDVEVGDGMDPLDEVQVNTLQLAIHSGEAFKKDRHWTAFTKAMIRAKIVEPPDL